MCLSMKSHLIMNSNRYLEDPEVLLNHKIHIDLKSYIICNNLKIYNVYKFVSYLLNTLA